MSSESDKPGKKALALIDLEDRELKKAVEMVHMSNRLTLPQKKIFDNLVIYAYPNLSTKEVHQASVRQLVKDTGFDSKNTGALRASLKSIMEKVVDLAILNKDGGEPGWKGIHLLNEVEINNGIVTYEFGKTIRKLVDNPKVFALINLRLQNEFVSVYSWNLYEQIVRFSRVHSTGWIDLETWRKLLGAEDPTYQSFKMLNYVVLKPAIREVNAKGKFIVTPEYKKLGRTVTEIKFDIQDKPDANVNGEAATVANEDVKSRIMALGISERETNSILSEHMLGYVEGNLDIVETRLKSGNVKPEKYPAYFKKALKEDWRPGLVTFDKTIVEERRAEEAKVLKDRQEAARVKEESSKASSQRIQNAREYYDSLGIEDQQGIEKRFAIFIEANNSFAHKNYQKNGLTSSTTKKTFDIWLAEQIAMNAK